MNKKPFYLTTTLPYVNAPLHMGHALEFVRADTIARYKKIEGFEVFFNTGTDEHGIKIYEKAQENNLSPQEFVDKGFEVFKEQIKKFGITDEVNFIRTTDENHIKSAQEFWKRVYDNGYIYKKNYEAKYCVGCEAEKTDSELNDDGFCLEHPGKELKIINEENYFFKYSAFEDKLKEFYEKNPDFVIPEFRFNEIRSFVKSGLTDFSISRLKSKMPWGIEVPNDPDQVMYVWFDALVNYISTLGWPNEVENPDGKSDGDLFNKYWVNGTPTQYCGKDNNRFQSAMWQAMLMACDIPNSNKIIVNGFIMGEGGVKMSKSLGNVVDPSEIVEKFGTDALRLFLLKEISNYEDTPFSLERFTSAYNANLANGLGNLLSRTLKMSESYFDGKISNVDTTKALLHTQISDIKGENEKTMGTPDSYIIENILPKYKLSMDSFEIQKAVESIWEAIKMLDGYITFYEPYKIIKEDEEKAKAIIFNTLSGIRLVSQMLEPVLPETHGKINKLIKGDEAGEELETLVPKEPLFPRI